MRKEIQGVLFDYKQQRIHHKDYDDYNDDYGDHNDYDCHYDYNNILCDNVDADDDN